jgi:hypothetical protein
LKRSLRIPGLRRLRKWISRSKKRVAPAQLASPPEDVVTQWEKSGRPAPPPHLVKRQILKRFSDEYELRVLVETGTYYGDMVWAMRDHFDRVYSIELSEELHRKAQDRFKDAPNVELICGDSAVELGKLMTRLDRPTLFWLDGHYSAGVTARGAKDTPIYEELAHILSAPDIGHVIIIDDARCFGTDQDYPSLAQLSDFVRSARPNVDIVVQDDSIRITPR